jgi:hypothetical protein
MKNMIYILLVLLFLTGCAGIDVSKVSDEDLERISDKVIVCESPYLRVGTGCCLDVNSNNICDSDESHNLDDSSTEDNLDSDIKEDEVESSDEVETETDEHKEVEENENSGFEKISDSSFKFSGEFYSLEDIKVEYDYDKHDIEIKWEKFEVPELFKYYKVMYSSSDSDVRYPNQAAIKVVDDVMVDSYEFEKTLADGNHYFRVSVVLINNEVLHTDIEKVDVSADEVEFTMCKYETYLNNTLLSSDELDFDFNSNSKCTVEFNEIIDDWKDLFNCDELVSESKLYFRDSEDSEFKVIETKTCEPEVDSFDEMKQVDIGDGETLNVNVGGIQVEFKVEDIFNGGFTRIVVDGVSKSFVEEFDKIQVGDYYIQSVESLVSTRSGYISYASFKIANYDFTLNKDDYDYVCSEGYNKILALFDNDFYEVKETTCSSDSILKSYDCNGDNDDAREFETNCEFGCSGNSCVERYELPCDENLENGIDFSLAEGEDFVMDGNGTISIQSISLGKALITINGETSSIDYCEAEELNGYNIFVKNLVSSDRDSVAGYGDFQYVKIN